jgi:PTS system nitrogen regulatory IIA component
MTEIGEMIGPQAIGHRVRASGKRDALAALSVLAHEAYGLDAGVTLEAALERENLGGTGLGHGVAIPHARLRDLDAPKAVLAVFDPPVDFDAPDSQPADLVVLLLSPVDAGADHLKALARLSRALRRADVREALRAARSAAALHVLLSEHITTRAA